MRIVVFLFLFPMLAIPEELDIQAVTGQMCTLQSDIDDYGHGDPALCLINANRLDDIKWSRWKNRPETIFDNFGEPK